MNLLLPWGLLGLLSVAVLLLIYILRPNYQHKLVSSTFIWKLSLKYKKNLPVLNKILQKITRGGIRTPDLLVRSQTLYPTELRTLIGWLNFISKKKFFQVFFKKIKTGYIMNLTDTNIC